jgi:hypothetical protein
MIAKPPLEEGAVQESDTVPFPEAALTPEGELGGPDGVAERPWENDPVPTEFTHATSKV